MPRSIGLFIEEPTVKVIDLFFTVRLLAVKFDTCEVTMKACYWRDKRNFFLSSKTETGKSVGVENRQLNLL